MAQSVRSPYRLIYRSRQSPAIVANLDVVVGQIIETSMRRNRVVGISGLLLVAQGHFIQALEGGIDAVRMTYACIAMDPRHIDPHIISQGPAGQRLFAEWHMCPSSGSQADKAILAWLDGKGDFNPEALTAVSSERLLTNVADIQRRAALTAIVG